MGKAKFQHYVPRFYLRQFADTEGLVWVYDKKLARTYARKPSEIAGETYFYDAPKLEEKIGVEQFVEKFFQPFEGVAASILDRWLSKLKAGAYFRIYAEERMLFSMFLATQLVRTPSHRNFVMQFGALLKKLELKAYLETNAPQVANHPFEITWDAKRESYLHARSILDEQLLDDCTSVLNAHIWLVVANKSSHSLYTSDSPICKKGHKTGGWRSYQGYASEGIELMFPLSPAYSLRLLERTYWKGFSKYDGRSAPVQIEDENVEHDNCAQAVHSTRFVFCQQDDFDLAKRACADWPDITEPKRSLIATS
jgi:hypothetical protein